MVTRHWCGTGVAELREPALSLLSSEVSSSLVQASRHRRVARLKHRLTTAKETVADSGSNQNSPLRAALAEAEQWTERYDGDVLGSDDEGNLVSKHSASKRTKRQTPLQQRCSIRLRHAPPLQQAHPAKFLAGHEGTFIGQNRRGVVNAGFLMMHAQGTSRISGCACVAVATVLVCDSRCGDQGPFVRCPPSNLSAEKHSACRTCSDNCGALKRLGGSTTHLGEPSVVHGAVALNTQLSVLKYIPQPQPI